MDLIPCGQADIVSGGLDSMPFLPYFNTAIDQKKKIPYNFIRYDRGMYINQVTTKI